MKPFLRPKLNVVLRTAFMFAFCALSLVASARAEAQSPSEPCKVLASKVAALAPLGNVYLYVAGAGAITFDRIGGGGGISAGLLLQNGLRAPKTFPDTTGADRSFTLTIGNDPSFNSRYLSGRASILFPGGYNAIGFSISPSTGSLQWKSYTWDPAIQNPVTKCTQVGLVTLRQVDFPGATATQRTLPVVEVNALSNFPGYGSDSIRLLLRPQTSPILD